MTQKFYEINNKILLLIILFILTTSPGLTSENYTNKDINKSVIEMKMDNLSPEYLFEVEKLFYAQRDAQDYDTAINTANYLINTSIKYFGENHPQTGFAYLARARYYTELIIPDLAKKDLDIVYKIYEQNKENLDLKNNILYSYVNYYSNIEEYYEAIKYLYKALGDKQDTAFAYKTYGQIYSNMRANGKAKKYFNKYYSTIENGKENKNIELFEYHLLMAMLYQNEKAIDIFKEELNKAEEILKTYNNSRPDLEILLNIEKVQYFLDTKEFNEALNLLKKNKKLIYKYGQKYQKTNIIQQFIDCYKDQKNLFKFNLYARKMNNFYNSLPSDSLLFLTLAEKQIDLYRTIGKIEEANKYAQNALNKLEPVKEYVPKLYGKFLRKAAEIKIQEENTAEAQIYLEQAIESYKKTIPEESFEFYEIYQSYGNLSNTNENKTEAENYYKKADSILKILKK